VGEGFPVVWFELPLLGDPRFDLHVALAREMLLSGARSLPYAGERYRELFDWYATGETGGNGLAFAFDVSEWRIDDPAVHVNVNGSPLSSMSRFFNLAAGNGAAERYEGFADRLPTGWRVWYAGVHPGRPGSPVRVDCFVSAALKEEYAQDGALLEHDLRSCGFGVADTALQELAAPILESPFNLELQFDVMHDGSTGPTLGISAGFSLKSESAVRAIFSEGGAASQLMDAIEALGLSDARWRHVPGTAFSRFMQVDGALLALYCVPTFVKLRLRDGKPLDAKMYLQAGARILS
jgi:hypothetical protein